MPRYDRPLWQIVQDCLEGMGVQFTPQEIIGRVEQQHPGFDDQSIRRILRFMSANDAWSMPSVPKVLFKIDRSMYRRYDPERDPAQPRETEDSSEPVVFPLELHLEEFMAANWHRINFGRPLRIYGEGSSGRQFQTSVGIVDFLCEDTQNGDLVVVELKKGRSSDRVLGQCQRYMGWVQANLAKPGQSVRGLIVAPDLDHRLQYALKVAPSIDTLCYRVDFELFDPDTKAQR